MERHSSLAIVAPDEQAVPRAGSSGSNDAPCDSQATRWTVCDWMLLPILLLATFLRLQQISTVGVSYDESFTQKMVEFPWGEMLDRIGQETQPPLFYAMLKVWTQLFGRSVVAGRLLTSFFGVVAVAGMYAFVKSAYHRKNDSALSVFWDAGLPALLAATLLALSPLQIFWTLQIRMYSLPIALTLWSSYFLVRALAPEGKAFRAWVAYTTLAVLLAYSHYFGLFVIAAQYVYAAGFRWAKGPGDVTQRLLPVVTSGCCFALGLQPWIPYFLGQRSGVERDFYLPKPSWNLLGTTMHELWAGVNAPQSATIGLILTQVTIIVLLLLVMGRRPADFLIALSALAPVAASFLISWISHPIITARYFLFGQVFVIAAVSVVACRIPRPARPISAALLVLLFSIPCQAHYQWREGNSKLPGMQALVARVESARGQDPLVVSNPMFYTSLLTYISDRSQVYNFLPPHGFPMYQGTPVMQADEYVDGTWIRNTDHRFLWTLDTDSFGQVPLPQEWNLISEERYQEWFGSLILRLYSRPGAARSGAGPQ